MYQKIGYLAEQLRLFYISDRTDQKFPYHYHDFDKITLFFQGDVQYEIEGKTYSLQPYDIVLVQAGQLHRPIVHNTANYERIIAYLSPMFFEVYRKQGCDLSCIFSEARSHVLRQPQEVSNIYGISCRIRQAFNEKKEDSPILQQTLFLEFMLFLARDVREHHIGYVKTGNQNGKIQTIIEYINTHLTNDLSIPDIASLFYISPDYLMHLFKNETGYSLANYITTKRLLLARNLIQQGFPLTTVCYDSGFRNYSTFYRAWKNLFRTSPRQGTTGDIGKPKIVD
ncbi:AraC family transcriptional regulator [Megasphaera paucivorans]|uniref:AraC-type DNA-binding protein n=1 Tax=Megasphaera paucivorans TaxID=349095 RepID=A0A1G9XHS9_9FIRM|nr:AraC family transcriptional regulator [Megasphaera paucivorans]SDM96091.1 AraC-type DNA-binding protein [Megasphaera paucivorans]